MNNTLKNTVRAGFAALLLATLSSASFAGTYDTRGPRLHTVAAGESITVRCASCASKINAKVTSVSGAPKTSVARNGRIMIGYICTSCATR